MPDTPSSEAPYSSDAPLTTRDHDRFNRWPFAERVAHVLRDRREASSLVVGLYGTWGEGKTTVLNFIEEALDDAEDVVVVRFNPWRFGDEATLIRRFFDALAAAVGRKLTTRREDFARAAATYAGALSLGVYGVTVDAQKAAEAFEVSLDDVRSRLTGALQESGLRVVVRVDDIDRLDKDEIQAVFRLVKLSADFEHVAYVLALDPDMVAAALQERYGPGQPRAGYDFLEKIVTVPLQVPPAQPQALYEIAVEAVNDALALAGVGLPDRGHRFSGVFSEGFAPTLKTPRMAKRYGNVIRFALPILAGEVNPTDQLLVEGMRVLYPSLYDHVRSNKALYLRTPSSDLFAVSDTIEQREARAAEVDRVISDRVPQAVGGATLLVDELFPAARGGNDPDASELRKGKHVASEWYFERYFSYAVPSDSVADRALADLVTLAEGGDAEAVTDRLATLATPRRCRALAWALAFHAASVPAAAARPLAVAIARLSDRFRDAGGAGEWRPPEWRALVSAGVMLRSIPKGPRRDEAAEAVVESCPEIELALTVIRHFGAGTAGEPGPLLDEAGQARIRAALAERIAGEAAQRAPHLDPLAASVSRYRIWAEHRSREEVADYIRQRLASAPGEVVPLLRAQAPSVWQDGETEPYPGEYEQSTYDAAAAYLDLEDVAAALASVYAPEVLNAGWIDMDYVRMGLDGYENVSEDEGLARQFMAVHRAATASSERGELPTAESGR